MRPARLEARAGIGIRTAAVEEIPVERARRHAAHNRAVVTVRVRLKAMEALLAFDHQFDTLGGRRPYLELHAAGRGLRATREPGDCVGCVYELGSWDLVHSFGEQP